MGTLAASFYQPRGAGRRSDPHHRRQSAERAGGLLGHEIAIIRVDASSAQQAITTMDRMATQEKVDIFSGTYLSAMSNSGSDAAARYNKLWWETQGLARELTEHGLPNYISAGSNGDYFALVSAKAVIEMIAPQLKKSPKDVSVWIEHEDSIYGTSIAEVQQKILGEAGVKVLGKSAHPARATELTDSVLRAKRANPDVWMETGCVPDRNLLLRAARDQGFKPAALLWSGVGDTPETRDAFGADFVEGMLVTAYARADVPESYGPGAAAFLANYRARYNREPIAPQGLGANSGLRMPFDTIKAAGSVDLEKIKAAAVTMDKPISSDANDYGLKFDQNFQNVLSLPTVVQWQGGEVKTVYPTTAKRDFIAIRNIARG